MKYKIIGMIIIFGIIMFFQGLFIGKYYLKEFNQNIDLIENIEDCENIIKIKKNSDNNDNNKMDKNLRDNHLKNKLKNALEKADKELNMLWKYYEPVSHNMLNRALMLGFGNDKDNGIDAKPYHEKNFKYISDRIARALVHGKNFVIGGIGSSVLTGHDTCLLDRYTNTLEKQMNIIFNETNSKFVFKNAAIGGECEDSMANQIYCFRHLMGEDLDVVHYEYTYYSTTSVFQEIMLRWLLMLERSPAIVFYTSSDEPIPNHQPSEQGNFTQFLKTLAIKDLKGAEFFTKTYQDYGFNAYAQERHITLNGHYPGGKCIGCETDGLHETTRKGEEYKKMKISVSMDEIKSQRIVYRNWHPGALGHQAANDAFAYYYLKAFKDAVNRILDSIEKKLDLDLIFPKRFAPITLSMLPGPVHTLSDVHHRLDLKIFEGFQRPKINIPKSEYLSKDKFFYTLLYSEEPPSCVTYEYPVFGRPQIGIEDPTSPFNPYVEEFREKKYVGWKNIPGPQIFYGPRIDVLRPECDHGDHCGGIVSYHNNSGKLVYRLPKMEIGYVIICLSQVECPLRINDFKKQLYAKEVEIELDGELVDISKIQATYWSGNFWRGQKCLIVQDQFHKPVKALTGHVYLSIQRKTTGCLSLGQVIAG